MSPGPDEKAPFSVGRTIRELDAKLVSARADAAEAMTKAPEDARSIVLRQHEEPTQDNRIPATVTDVEAVTDAGHATLLSAVATYGVDLLPAVLVAARQRALVVEYRRDSHLLQRFDPELPLMYRASRPLEDALATLAGAGYRVSREGDAIAVARNERRSVVGWWIGTILMLPLVLLWWLYFLSQMGAQELRRQLADCYVPGVSRTRRVVVGPTGVSFGETRVDRSQIVAIVRFRDADSWVWVGLVSRDGVLRLGEGATSSEQALRLEPEHVALADVLAHVLAGAAGGPYRG